MNELWQAILRVIGRQRLLDFGKTRLIYLASPPDFSTSKPFEYRFAGHPYDGDMRFYVDWWIYFFGVYEPHLAKLLIDQATEIKKQRGSVTYVDVGANIGPHSLMLANVCDKVIAFEPNPEFLERHLHNLRNSGHQNVEIKTVGLGDKPGEFSYFAEHVGTGWFTEVGQETGQVFKVQRGDDALAELSRVDLLKIDVDGFEPSVLRGLKNILERDHPVILLEWSPDFQKRAGVLTEFTESLLYTGAQLSCVSQQRWTWNYRLRPASWSEVPREGKDHLYLVTSTEDTQPHSRQ